MRDYLSAECYKAFRRKYFYIALAVCLVLEGTLLWGYWQSMVWGNVNIDFYSTASMVVMLLSVGMYATLITEDVVFSDQYKYNTMKNEVSYGLPRERIFFGKLLVSTFMSLLAAAVMLGFYVGGCWILFPHGEMAAETWSLIGYCLAGAIPLWLGVQALTNTFYFLIPGSTLNSFLVVGVFAVVPLILKGFGLLFHPVFFTIRQFMPAVMLDSLKEMAFRWDYVGQCWLVGLVWMAVSIAIGLLYFRKKEIH